MATTTKPGHSSGDPGVLRQYLRLRDRRHRPYTGDKRALAQFRQYLANLKIIPCDDPPALTPMEQCVQEFRRYLSDERGLAPSTIANYCVVTKDLLSQTFPAGPLTVDKLAAEQIIDFVRKRAPMFSRK